MKLGCCSWSYHRTMEAKKLTFEQWLELCAKELKVGGVDMIAEQMPKRTNGYWLLVKKRCTDLQLTIISLSPGNDFGKPTAAQRRRQVDYVKGWIECAVILGAPIVRIFAGWPGERRHTLWGPMVECIRRCAAFAQQAGVTLAIEPHDQGGFLPTSTDTLRLIREINSPWVRINLDTGNYLEPDIYRGLARTLPLAPHVVAKVYQMHPDGESVEYDYDRIFRMLKQANYRGFITLEYEGKADERTSVPKALAMLRRYGTNYEL